MILLFRSSAGRGSEERRTTARDLIASSFLIVSPSKRDPRYYKRSCFLSSEYVLETKHINRKTSFEHFAPNIELRVCGAKTSTVTLSFYSSFSMSYT